MEEYRRECYKDGNTKSNMNEIPTNMKEPTRLIERAIKSDTLRVKEKTNIRENNQPYTNKSNKECNTKSEE